MIHSDKQNDSDESVKMKNNVSHDSETNKTLSKLFSTVSEKVRTTAEATLLRANPSSSYVSLDLSNDPIVFCDSTKDLICICKADTFSDAQSDYVGDAGDAGDAEDAESMTVYQHTCLSTRIHS